ncbi:hypothetical protein [Kamptonema formosum]|uniref:hypothetical protein n=1 Tax=Kamptonema formosum TaxID=331992 RepID=UPI0018E1E616|nr:hypothetical protein [Oscillatoria sp. PCC 10802]
MSLRKSWLNCAHRLAPALGASREATGIRTPHRLQPAQGSRFPPSPRKPAAREAMPVGCGLSRNTVS